MYLACPYDKKPDWLKSRKFRVIQHERNIIDADHLPLMQAHQDIAFLKSCTGSNTLRPYFSNQ